MRRSEERYRTVLEDMEEGYFGVDLAGNLLFFNEAICHQLGCTRGNLIGTNYQNYMGKEDAKAVYQVFNEVYRTGRPIKDHLFRIVRNDGSVLFTEDSIFPVRNTEGEIIGFRGVSRDVTVRKEMEKKLWESEERYRALFNHSLECVYVHDLEGNFLDANQAALSLLGYEREEITSLNFASLLSEGQIPQAFQVLQELISTGAQREISEYKLRCKDGKQVYVETLASVVYHDGKSYAIQGIARDITARKKAEEALRQSEERYRTILEDIEDNYFEVDIAGNVTFANDSTCRSLGYSKPELIGLNYRAFTVDRDVETVYSAFNSVYQTGNPRTGLSWEVVRKDGINGFVEASVFPLRNEQGEIIGFRGVGRDVTERRIMEQQVLVASKLASIGELASGVAHELNNPLTSVMGYAQLLFDSNNVAQEVRADLEKIYEESYRAAKILQNLLGFARQRKPEKNHLDVNEIIEKVLDLRSYGLRTGNIGVYVDLAPEIPEIMADYHQIQQVMLNILVNAEQALAEVSHRGKIWVKSSTGKGYVRISIADNGPGINRDNISRIFDPFFTTKEMGKGTGLGLSVCHGIVTAHGGNIYVQSEEGKRTTFTIELPEISVDTPIVDEEAKTKQMQPRRRKAKGRILIVDDEPAICESLTRVLSDSGYQTDSVSDARTALTKITSTSYDLYIIDLKMPKISGKRLYENMKGRDASSAEKVMFITGDTITPNTQAFLESTRRPYLTKPFVFTEAIKLVEEALVRMHCSK